MSEQRFLQILRVISTCFPAPCLSSGGSARQILGVISWSLCLFCSPLTRLSRSHESELSFLLPPCSVCLFKITRQLIAVGSWTIIWLKSCDTVTTICLQIKSWVNTKRLCVICNSNSLMSLTTPWWARSVCLRLRGIWSKSCPRSKISIVVTRIICAPLTYHSSPISISS